MLTEFHCPCGHRARCVPDELGAAVKCEHCGASLSFRRAADGPDETRWLLVGGAGKAKMLAVPVPRGVRLTIGRSTESWLVLPGDAVDETHAEITLRPDLRLSVKHVGGEADIWINQAKIISGVVNDGDELRIGPYVMNLCTQAELAAEGGAGDVETVIVEEAEPEDEWEDEGGDESSAALYLDDGGTHLWHKAKVAGSLLVLLACGVYLTRTFMWPAVSPEMPAETEYRCTLDGTVFRAPWSSTPPVCPECGQRCFGSVRSKVQRAGGPPAASMPAGEGGQP